MLIVILKFVGCIALFGTILSSILSFIENVLKWYRTGKNVLLLKILMYAVFVAVMLNFVVGLLYGVK